MREGDECVSTREPGLLRFPRKSLARTRVYGRVNGEKKREEGVRVTDRYG